ncbi:MAG: ParB/RepB/Spo0J family partition protein [Saprospiraceae bacterium]
MAKRKQIGRGVASILGNINLDTEEKQEKEKVVKTLASTVAMLPINQIEAYRDQPRKEFEETALSELSESIKVHGLIQPITVRRVGHKHYQLISGERRLRASKLAKLKQIPAYVRVANDQEMLEMALVENIQREDLNPIEVATTYERLMEECNLTHKLLAQRVGKTRSSVTNYLRLLKLPPQIKTGLQEQTLSMGHARTLAGITENSPLQIMLFHTITKEGMSVRQVEKITKSLGKLPPSILASLTAKKIELGHAIVLAELNDPALQLSLHREILEKGLSVEQVEAFVNRQKQKAENKNQPKSPKSSKLSFEYQKMQDSLSHHFQTKVAIKRGDKGKGQIVLNFTSDEDFNRLLELIEGE